MKKIALVLIWLIMPLLGFATGEPSTYFNIFVPPNNDPVRRDVALIVTAIYDSTSFTIVDDGADGDTDDNVTGILMAGQSYVLYIRDNGINDDARYASGGVWKQDGDYFIITANQAVYASQSTNSDWQHDWVPAVNRKSLGQKFIVYSPVFSSSKRDINVFAYTDNTSVTVKRISTNAKTNTGYTDVNWENATVVMQTTLNRGQDLIYSSILGRDLMDAGATYVVETSQPVTLQYGALFGNERDGGGYVPSSNGSSSGELFYFGVPYQAGTNGEQEIRVVSWDNANSITLERYSNGNWVAVKSYTANLLKAVDWVGRNEGNVNYPTVFRLRCSEGKKVSVFEGNWFETGSPGTSDMATMLSSESGTTAGTRFLSYMAPPGNQANVRNPNTGTLYGQRLTHLYLFAQNGATVTVKDAFTNGAKISKTFTIAEARYADCFLTEAEWKSIYNNTGTTAAGPERPYLLVESNQSISVMNTNFNDNWMMYFGSSQKQGISVEGQTFSRPLVPGETSTFQSNIQVTNTLTQTAIEVQVGTGLQVVKSELTNSSNSDTIKGTVTQNSINSIVRFNNEPTLLAGVTYTVNTTVEVQVSGNNGALLPNNSVANIETKVSGQINGKLEQGIASQGLSNNTSNTSNLMFGIVNQPAFSNLNTDSWNASWTDYNNDGWEDLIVTERDATKPNYLFKNVNGVFTRVTTGALVNNAAQTMNLSCADFDNDGDVDVLNLNNTRKSNFLFENLGNGNFGELRNRGINSEVAYYHSGSFVDYDRDGKLDVFLTNYWPTKFNELYKQTADGNWTMVPESVLSKTVGQSTGVSWADYNNDNYPDLFIPNGNGGNNMLYKNLGNGNFELQSNSVVCSEGGSSKGSCWGDIDNDGDLDLFVANASNKTNFLYFNNGNGTFTKTVDSPVVTTKGHSHGCSFADIDNDADLDLYVTNDQGYKELYLNDGNGAFTMKDNELITANYGKSFGHVWADYDKDGDVDLFVATHSNQPNYLFNNLVNDGNWINIKLEGVISNKSAIGAKIRCKAGDVWQMREVNAQSGFGGQSSLRQHFGFGLDAMIDTLQVIWPSGQVQNLTDQLANQFLTITEPSASELKGFTYSDLNNNCIKDSNEPIAPFHKITIKPGNRSIISDANGAYSVWLENDNYVFTPVSENNHSSTCGTQSLVISTIGQQTSDLNFGFTNQCQLTDLQVFAGATAFRRGFTIPIRVEVRNNGVAKAENITFTTDLDAQFTFKYAVPEPTSVTTVTVNNQPKTRLIWSIDSLISGRTFQAEIWDSLSVRSTIGSLVGLSIAAVTNQSDCDITNNNYLLSDSVVGAIDPNDMLTFTQGLGVARLISNTETIRYKIRFQNVGNHLASKVAINNPLPDGLDISTLVIEGTSHVVKTTTKANNLLQFIFNDINLPDSNSNEPGSHGWVQYSIKPKKNTTKGTELTNSASITFDYEDPIFTNSITHTIWGEAESKWAVNVGLSPNPSQNQTLVSLVSTDPLASPMVMESISIVSVSGKSMETFPAGGNNQFTIPTSQLLAGIYIVEVKTFGGKKYHARLVVSN